MLMDQIIPIPVPIHIPTNSVSVSETKTETEIKNHPPRPTFDCFVSMIDSFTQLPTPTPLPLLYSEPEPGPVTIFGTYNNVEGNNYDHDHVSQIDTVDHPFGLGLLSGLEPTLEEDQGFYGYNDKALIPFSSGYDLLPINNDTNLHFDTSSPINQFSHTDTPLHQFDTPYSTINQFADTEYTLPPPPTFAASLDQHQFLLEAVDPFLFPFDTQPPQPEQLAISPSGHWTPITPTSHLPSQDLAYLYEPFPPPQVQVPQYIQDHTPTLAPHYPDYEFDLDFEMTNDPFQPKYSWDQIRTVTPISTTDHRPIVSCRPTMKFSLPSALGDSVHDPETFGLKAETVGGVDERYPTPTGHRYWNTNPRPVSNWKDNGPTSTLPMPKPFGRDYLDGRERMDLRWSSGGGNGLAKSINQNNLFESRDQHQYQHQQPFTGSRSLINNNGLIHGNDLGQGEVESSIIDYSRRPFQFYDINNNPISRPRSVAPQKIHPRPTYHPPSFDHHHLPSFSQPPPHTYTPTPSSMSSANHYPPTPITSYHPQLQHGNPILPGVHHLFDHHLQVNPNNHTHTASPSTIFPNAKQYSHPTDVRTNSFDPTRGHVASYPKDTRVESSYNVGMNGQEIREVESASPDHISIDIPSSRTSTGSESSFESEEGEGEGGDDMEEVLSEYKPGKTKTNNKSKSKSKGKSKNKNKNTSQSKGKDHSGNGGKGQNQKENVLKGLKRHSEFVMKKMEREGAKVMVQQKVQGKSMAGYEFIWEGGVAYTDDAELKQTREVRRRCHNCNTRSPPSWRKSNLVPGKILCNKCGIYERTHNKPRPQQQDEMKLRRNPTPPPSLGGYEPLEYDDEDEDDLESESSPVSQYSYIDSDQISSPVVDMSDKSASPQPMGMEVEVGIPERHQFEESICRDEATDQITPISASNSPPSPQIIQPFPLLFLPPTTQASVNEIISLSQPQPQSYQNLNAPLDTDSRQLPPLRTVTAVRNNQSSSLSGSGSGSIVPSPTTPSTGIIPSRNGNGWEGKIALTPYSRPGSRSDLRSVSSTSLRGVDSGRWV